MNAGAPSANIDPAAQKRRQGYAKKLRIRQRADFTRCYEHGRRYYSEHFIFFVLPRDEEAHDACGAGMPTGRTGMAVSRKVGNAVTRNRIKRLLREFFRLHRTLLPPADLTVVAKKHAGAADMNLATVCEECLPLLRRMQKTRH